MAFVLDLKLHSHQQAIYADTHRYKVIAAGRQFGKSTFTVRAAAGVALTKPETVGLIVAPYAKQAYKDYRLLLKFIKDFEKAAKRKFIEETSAKWLTFTLTNGSEIMMGSGENVDGLRGFTLDWVIVDEAAFCDEEVWQVLEPALGMKQGVGWFISTPNGKGWFYDLYCRHENDPEFQSFHFTTYDHEEYPRSEIERMKRNMPEVMFRQEVMAEFLEGGLVFPHLDRVMTDANQPREPLPGHDYVTGADIAGTNDFTVIKTFDTADNTEVHSERVTDREWGYIKTKIYAQCKRYNNSTLIIDKTGVGAPVVEDLQKMDAPYAGAPKQGHLTVVPIVFSTVSKPQLYSNYIMMQENLLVHLLNDPVTKREHEDFQMTRSQGTTGYIKYAAPKGKNDDTVTACALACWGLDKYGGNQLIGPILDQSQKPKKEIDPAHQIDVEKIMLGLESKQIAGFNSGDDELDIARNYD